MTENTPLEHQNVPVAHQGLHTFLYGSDNEHSAERSAQIVADGTNIIEVSQWERHTGNNKVAGVYAVLDSDRIYQYVGYSRDVLRSVRGHIAQNGDREADAERHRACTYIRVQTFKFPKRQAMEATKDEWIAELDYTPAGNAGEGTWAGTIGEAAKATMTAEERNAYEEKKLKLRKAMADASLIDELTAQDNLNDAEVKRRQQLEAAVKNDDWSSVIDSQ